MIDLDWNGAVVIFCDGPDCAAVYPTVYSTVTCAADGAIADGWDVDSDETAHCPECKEKHTP